MPWSLPCCDELSESESSTSSYPSSEESGSGNGRIKRGAAMFQRLFHGSHEIVQGGKVNPFSNPNDPRWTPYEIFKLVLLGPTVMPIRLAIIILIIIIAGLVARIATIGVPLEREGGCYYHKHPLTKWRRALLSPLIPLQWVLLVCFGFFHVETRDRRRDPSVEPNIMVVSPHMTDIDILIVAWVCGNVCAVGDSNILYAPFVGWLGIGFQNIFVDLRNKEGRQTCAEVIKYRADANNWDGPPTVVFPEGRITNGKVLIQYKHGAFTPGQPVQPIILRFPWRHYNPVGQSRANHSFLWPVRILTQFCNHCIVEKLEVYVPNADEREDANLFANNVRAKMAEALGVETTNHGFDDATFFREASKRFAAPHLIGDFEVEEARSKLDVDCKQLTEWLQVFRRMDKDGNGSIDRKEFKRHNRKLGHMFDFFDMDGNKVIEYREFVHGLAILAEKCPIETQARLAFHYLDRSRRGHVWHEEAQREVSFEEFLHLAKDTPSGRALVRRKLQECQRLQDQGEDEEEKGRRRGDFMSACSTLCTCAAPPAAAEGDGQMSALHEQEHTDGSRYL